MKSVPCLLPRPPDPRRNHLSIVIPEEPWHTLMGIPVEGADERQERSLARYPLDHGAENSGCDGRPAWLRDRTAHRTDQQRPAGGEPRHALPGATQTGARGC